MADASFYAALPVAHGELPAILRDPKWFKDVPADWSIIVTDVQGSTQAVQNGQGRDLNTVAASCVIAALNVAKARKTEVAFFYGGDGATLVVPEFIRAEIIDALQALRANAFASYRLRLRVGFVGVAELIKAEKVLKLAKWAVAPGYTQALALGDGLGFADAYVKADLATLEFPEQEPPREVNLDGLMCRWETINPAIPKEEVVCLIVEATERNRQAEVYAKVIETLDEIYGAYHTRHPVSPEQLVPSVSASNLRRKSLLAKGQAVLFSVVDEFIRACLTALSFKTSIGVGEFKPTSYVQELILATDTLHISGTLLTIVAGTVAQRTVLRAALDRLETMGELIYGAASCPSSVMTCYVQHYDARHVHFLDGQMGGYTQASKEWKAKRKKTTAV